MNDVFVSVEVKLDRATHHFDVLQSWLNEFIGVDPDSRAGLRIQKDAERGMWEARAHVPDPIPLPWGVRIGEVLYQLRSVLDHLINGLVTTPTKDTAFPICDTEANYRSLEPRYLADLVEPYRTLVYEIQPFWQKPREPRSTTLWNLNEWARLDRHRFLHVAEIWLRHCRFDSIPLGRITLDFATPGPFALEHGAVVASGRILPDFSGSKTEVDVYAEFGMDVALAELSDMRIPDGIIAVQAIDGLGAMLVHIRDDIVPAFKNPRRLVPLE